MAPMLRPFARIFDFLKHLYKKTTNKLNYSDEYLLTATFCNALKNVLIKCYCLWSRYFLHIITEFSKHILISSISFPFHINGIFITNSNSIFLLLDTKVSRIKHWKRSDRLSTVWWLPLRSISDRYRSGWHRRKSENNLCLLSILRDSSVSRCQRASHSSIHQRRMSHLEMFRAMRLPLRWNCVILRRSKWQYSMSFMSALSNFDLTLIFLWIWRV